VKQILQSLKDGNTELAQVPAPYASAGQLLIHTSRTLVSAGTERMLVEFGKANWIDKARQQPDKVRMVLEKVRTDGLAATWDAVQSKLDQPLPLGYCNVGRVAGLGAGVSGFSVGERVVSNGKHAEVVCVPQNLCARVPDAVSDEAAAFTVLGAIALQGLRLIAPTLGESVVVTGLGLIGLLAVQLLRAQGCRVMGIDFDAAKIALARRLGAEVVVNPGAGEDVLSAAQIFSRGRGVDAVLITASTKSNEPVSQAARMCRKRGRIVLVGVTGLELARADFYEKELSFQVSCSYGPGRYDPAYEEGGQDYPVGFVRWTEQRNFEAVLDMMAAGKLDVQPLISHRFAFERAVEAYELLASKEPSLGILLEYAQREPSELAKRSVVIEAAAGQAAADAARPGTAASVAFLGSGNYAGRVLMPAFQAAGARLHTVVSAAGVSAAHYGHKFGFLNASTDGEAMLADPAVDTVVIATRHNAHARQVIAALRAGKHVFCEKPLCLTLAELEEIEAAYWGKDGLRRASNVHGSGSNVSSRLPPLLHGNGDNQSSRLPPLLQGHGDNESSRLPPLLRQDADRGPRPLLMVGFNRRFAPQVVRMKALLSAVQEPKSMVMTVNAGAIPPEHWTQNPEVGGGRIIGEACHFIDLLRHLAGAPITSWQRSGMSSATHDTVTLQLGFADGSVGTVHYFANGSKSFPKERLEVFAAGRVLQLDNFRKLTGFGWPGFGGMNLWRQNKGQVECAKAFVDARRSGGPAPISWSEILEVSRVSIELAV